MPPLAMRQANIRKSRSVSRYGKQLHEKQQLKELFGLREEQFKKYYREAKRYRLDTGKLLVTLLERRLDNAAFRAGFAQTRPHARQMTSHGLFTVNGKPVDKPSFRIKVGDIVAVKETKRKKSYFLNFAKRTQGAKPPSWIRISPKDYTFTITDLPSFEEANVGVDIQSVVEFFAR